MRNFVPKMGKNKKFTLENVLVEDLAAEGKAIAKRDGKVFFIKNALPGDVVDIFVYRNKSSFAEAEVTKFHSYSPDRVAPICAHFGVCGGCKVQDLHYEKQLAYKQKIVYDQIARIGKTEPKELLPIVGSQNIFYYRNKIEYTFTNNRWLTNDEVADKETQFERNGAGFYMPGRFDKVLDLDICHLQDTMGSQIRLETKKYALENNISFFDLYQKQGALRNVMIRNTTIGEWMVFFSFGEPMNPALEGLLRHLQQKFPQVTAWLYVINQKLNDTTLDLPVHVFAGKLYIVEKLRELQFRISSKSFFQTNTHQGQVLYDIAKDFAQLSGNEIVYDLYTGTGSIACYIADKAQKVVGIEYVEDAIEDAKINASINHIDNTLFFAGDMKDVLNDQFIATHGQPDVIITDPPRAGMHEDVVRKILEVAPPKIVYVSCNAATQARDIQMLSEQYELVKMQAVDMFPHTHHIENVALLVRK